MVGDDVTADVGGASAVGMCAVSFHTGFWPGARTNQAVADVHDRADLPAVLEALR